MENVFLSKIRPIEKIDKLYLPRQGPRCGEGQGGPHKSSPGCTRVVCSGEHWCALPLTLFPIHLDLCGNFCLLCLRLSDIWQRPHNRTAARPAKDWGIGTSLTSALQWFGAVSGQVGRRAADTRQVHSSIKELFHHGCAVWGHICNQVSQFRPSFTISCRPDQTRHTMQTRPDKAYNADRADRADNADNLYNVQCGQFGQQLTTFAFISMWLFNYRAFFRWYPPKKLKYGKPRLGESTLT